MEEIKVNDYVRLARNQGINKIIYIDDECHNYHLDTEIADEWGETAYSIRKEDLGEEVLKHSQNIIDLIEVGDYVNGYKVLEKTKSSIRENGICILIFRTHSSETWKTIFEDEIESIVTREQFNFIKYRLE